MKRMLMALALALGAATLGIAACGGDSGALTLVEYFSAHQRISDAAEEQFDSIAPAIGGSGAMPDESNPPPSASLKELRDLFREILVEFEEINPPDEAQALHEELLEAGGVYLQALDAIIADVDDLDSPSDGLDLYADVGAAFARFNANCLDLQKLADGESIDVDLGCE